jgi:hypothetical protein
LSASPANPAAIIVAVFGILQDPTTYSISGNTLTFSGAPPAATGNISVRYLGIPASGVTTTAYRTVTEYTATSGQTTFTPPSYTVGFISVFRNGVRLGSADYTASNGTTVVLASGATLNDLVTIESYYVSSYINAIPNTANSVTNLLVADAAITQSKLSTNVAGNGPAFSVYASSTQTLTNSIYTKIQLNTETFDTNNNFDSSTNYRFTPTVAGYYQINANIYMADAGVTGYVQSAIYKNGSAYKYSLAYYNPTFGNGGCPVSDVIYFNGSTDYIEYYVRQTNGSSSALAYATGSAYVYMSGALVRAT